MFYVVRGRCGFVPTGCIISPAAINLASAAIPRESHHLPTTLYTGVYIIIYTKYIKR